LSLLLLIALFGFILKVISGFFEIQAMLKIHHF